MDHDIIATCPDALQAHTATSWTHMESREDKTTRPGMHERVEKSLRVECVQTDGKLVMDEIW